MPSGSTETDSTAVVLEGMYGPPAGLGLGSLPVKGTEGHMVDLKG